MTTTDMKHCTKKRFRDEIAAKLAISRIQYRDNPARPKSERRAYYHPVCKRWHLTSTPKGGAVEMDEGKRLTR